MKLMLILYLSTITSIICVIPNWKFDEIAIELTELEYQISSNRLYQIKTTVRKEINKSTNPVSSKNYVRIERYNDNNEIIYNEEKEVEFEDVESSYYEQLGATYLVCPKNRYHPYNFGEKAYIKPGGISYENGDDFKIKCYKHSAGFFIVAYLGNGSTNFVLRKMSDSYNNWNNNIQLYNGLYDFDLANENNGVEGEYNMIYLTLKNNDGLYAFSTKLTLKSDYTGRTDCQKKKLVKDKTYSKGYFKDNAFFYITYDETSFQCGYSIDGNGITKSNAESAQNAKFYTNDEYKFEFADEIKIKEMNFIDNTNYVYYILENKKTGNNYYGLIDIKKNKVIYNTDEEIKTFVPYSSNQMLAITSTSAYKICAYMDSDGANCIESCSNEFVLDTDGNKCQEQCPSGKVLLFPQNICNLTCDENYYFKVDNKCGLCKDLNNDNPYKLIGSSSCLSTFDENTTEFYNEDLKLLKCKSGYKLEDNNCVPHCYSTCDICSEYSENDEEQKCIKCKGNLILDEGNCRHPPTTILMIPTTIIIPPTTIIMPPTTTIIPPSTVIIPPTTIIPPSTTVVISPTTVIIPPTTLVIPHTTVIIPPTTIITQPNTVKIPPTTIITPKVFNPSTIPLIQETECSEEKCLKCSEESSSLNLCLSCNEELGYRKVNYTLVFTEFVDCLKEGDPSLSNFYFNETTKEYRPCYKTCKKCLIGGDAKYQNCLECETNYMLRPGDNPYNNCVAYSEFYYIDSYNQYKSLKTLNCPEEAKYVVKEKKYCINDCKKDNEYKFLYNGQCVKECPSDTTNKSFICSESPNKIYLGFNKIDLNENDSLTIVNTLVKTYISEFNYTNNHASLYDSDNYNILLYKNPKIINDLALKMSKVDFNECYEKVKNESHIKEDLIITVVDKKNSNNPSSYYSFFNPKSGQKLDAENICKGEVIKVKENLTTILNSNDTNYKLQSSLTDQGINIFDINNPFYTDLCFDYKNPKKRDIPLSERIKNIFPNITLCNDGCQNDRINLEEMTATCNCKFNDITHNQVIEDNAVLNNMVGEIFDLINSSNILVVKCYKYIFKYFKNSIGGILTTSIISLNFILTFIFLTKHIPKISEYILSITNRYLAYLTFPSQKGMNVPPKRVSKCDIRNETKKKSIKRKKSLKNLKQNENNNNVLDNIQSKDKLNINEGKHKKKSIHKRSTKITINNPYTNEITTEYLHENEIIKKFVEEYLKTSPDEMEYDDAIKKDHRTFCEYFGENLKENQIIANNFIAYDPIKPRTIKIILFNLNLILYFVINGLFISESYIIELYNLGDKEENFFSFLPRSIERLFYTTVVSLIIGYITSFFFLEEQKVKGIFKRDIDDKIILKQNINELIKTLKQRYISFIIFVFIILIISLYYILCFNYVYPKTQIEWVKSSIAIIIIIQLLSILKILLEAILRFLSFICESEKLFQFGKLFS